MLYRRVGRQINRQLFVSFAFTLAEVLIVLGIIGVVAEMTIPTLVQNTQETVTITSVKKAYSVLSQAFTMAVQENGTPDTWNLDYGDSPVGAEEVLNKIAPYLKVTKNCGSVATGDCTPGNYLYLKGGVWGDANANTFLAKAELADGMIIMAESYGNCTGANKDCGDYRIDVNGFKKPNQFGKDLFVFNIKPTGIVPRGIPAEGEFDNNCKNPATDEGRACAAWIIYNGNMDYIKCPNTLSWNGPTKCN